MTWLEPSGREMSDEAWNAGFVRCLGVRWPGDAIDAVNERGERLRGDTLLLLFNAHHEAIPFMLPAHSSALPWERLLDTAVPEAEAASFAAGEPYTLQARSLAVLRIKAGA